MASKKNPKYDPGSAVPPLDFPGALGLIHEGKFADECTEKMEEAVRHVMKKGGKTKVTITLIYGAADDSGLNVLADVSVKLPPPLRRAQFLYSNKEGLVFEHSPTEVDLDFGVASNAGEYEAGAEAGAPGNVTPIGSARRKA